MKKKITAVLLCVAILMTLSVNVVADDTTLTLSTGEIINNENDGVMPLAESPSIVNNGVYRIKNVASGKYLNLHYGVDADNTNVYQWTGDGSTEQKWRISYNLATEAYQIYSMSSSGGKNRVLDLYDTGGNLLSGSNIKLYTPTEPFSQELDIYMVSSGKYRIVMKNNTNLCLTSYGTSNGSSGGTSSTSAGNVFVSNYTGSDNQKWVFEYTGTKVVVAPTGWFDSVSDTVIKGWTWRSDLPNSPLNLSLDIVNNDTGDTYYRSMTANVYRADLVDAGYGNGYHGFYYEIDWSEFPTGNYTITAYVGHDGTTYNLSGSPKDYDFEVKTTGDITSWNNSEYEASFIPKTGYIEPSFYRYPEQKMAETYCEFSLDNHNVTNILKYNSGQHEEDTKNLFFTVDIRNLPNSEDDKMHAIAFSTSLPNPKCDLENDNTEIDDRNEEAEIVALGEVENVSYYMYAYWYDYREGNSNDDGMWQVEFVMSGQYIGQGNLWIPSVNDYNTIRRKTGGEKFSSYGKYGGLK